MQQMPFANMIKGSYVSPSFFCPLQNARDEEKNSTDNSNTPIPALQTVALRVPQQGL